MLETSIDGGADEEGTSLLEKYLCREVRLCLASGSDKTHINPNCRLRQFDGMACYEYFADSLSCQILRMVMDGSSLRYRTV
jgi:hypothetical protein